MTNNQILRLRFTSLRMTFIAISLYFPGWITVPGEATDGGVFIGEEVDFFTQFSIMSWNPGRPSAVNPDLPGSVNSWMISTPLLSAQERT